MTERTHQSAVRFGGSPFLIEHACLPQAGITLKERIYADKYKKGIKE